MMTRALLLAAFALLAPATSLAASTDEAVRAAIVQAVREHIGADADIDVTLIASSVDAPGPFTASPTPGARLGEEMRITIATPTGQRFSVRARVTAVVGHVVATRPLARGVTPTPEDVEWRQAQVDDMPLEPLPQLEDVLAAETRRTIAAGEVIGRTAIVRPYAVRAGDTVSMTIRTGRVEARGVGRAVSSGFIGDIIRILRPGSRQPRRARIIAPAAVEILR